MTRRSSSTLNTVDPAAVVANGDIGSAASKFYLGMVIEGGGTVMKRAISA
jgi:hypothetical protein